MILKKLFKVAIFIIATFFYLIILSSCQTPVIRPDPNPSSFESNYPSLLVCAQGDCENGILTRSFNDGEFFSDLNLRVHVFFRGTVFVHSDALQVSERFEVSQTGFFTIPLHGVKLQSSVIFISFTPSIPNQEKQDQVIFGLHSFLMLTDQKIKSSNYFKFSQKSDRVIEIESKPNDSFFVSNMSECGQDLRRVSQGDSIQIGLSELMNTSLIKRCIFLILNQRSDDLHSVFSLTHSDRFSPLSIPHVVFEGQSVEIKGHRTVSLIGVEEKIFNQSEIKTKIPSQDFLVFLFTHKGRSIYGFCNSIKKECQWKR